MAAEDHRQEKVSGTDPVKKRCPLPVRSVLEVEPEALVVAIRQTNAAGNDTLIAYDVLGRQTSTTDRIGGVTVMGYDADSHLLTLTDAEGQTTVCTYDTVGNKRTERLQPNGLVSGYVYPDGTDVSRTYTARNQLKTVSLNGTSISTRTYDAGGRLTGEAYNNSVSSTRTYNADNTLAGIERSGSVGDCRYDWDANKNRTSERVTGVMSGYGFGDTGYDAKDRLTSWTRADNQLDQSWDLSLVGDWDNYTENNSVQSRTHGPTHELLSVGGQVVTQDPKGNQTLLPGSLGKPVRALSWDFENKLIGGDIDGDGTNDVTYTWDALQRRVARTDAVRTTVYVQNGQQTVADYVQGQSATGGKGYRYVYGDYIDEPLVRLNTANNTRLYYHRNQQYSIIAMTNTAGSEIERYDYDAYGEVTRLRGNGTAPTTDYSSRYTYTGREWDEGLDLYHYRARMYDPATGRFCSRDPIGFWGSMWSLYEFLNSNPSRWLDSLGLCPAATACIQEHSNTIKAARAFRDSQMADLRQEMIDMQNLLVETAEWEYSMALALAEQSRQNQLALCNEIDTSTIPGAFARFPCIATVEVEVNAALSAASIAYGIALAAVEAMVLTHHAARVVGIQGAYQLERELARTTRNECVDEARQDPCFQ